MILVMEQTTDHMKKKKQNYQTPYAKVLELTGDAAFLQASLDPAADISAIFAIDELGITDTDAASAIWF